MKRLLFPLIVLVALILVGTFVFQSVTDPPKLLQMPEQSATPPVTAKPAQLPKVDSGFEWSALDEAELEGMLQSLNGPSAIPVNREEFSAVLAPGESLITEGVEKEPGVFEFSQVSAKTSIFEGSEVIEILTKRVEITVGGEEKILSMPRIITRNGSPASIQSRVVNPDGSIVGGFTLEMKAEPVEGGISLKGTVIEH